MCQKRSLNTQYDFFLLFYSNIFQFYTFIILKVYKYRKKSVLGSFYFQLSMSEIALEQANITVVQVYATGTVQ